MDTVPASVAAFGPDEPGDGDSRHLAAQTISENPAADRRPRQRR
jgi:hypothetical protein